MTVNSQMGVKLESTYKTGVTVDRFYAYRKIDVKLKQRRMRSKGIRAAGRYPRASTLRVANQGGTISFEMEWMTKGMGWWGKPMLGAVATGSATDSAYPHTLSVASRYGTFFTLQANVPLHPGDTAQPCTFLGCKLAKWKLELSVDGHFLFSGEIDFGDYTTATALATASYPSAMQPYVDVDGSATIGGSAVPLTAFALEVDPGLNLDRYHIRGSATKSEPTHNKMEEGKVTLGCDFSALTQHNRVRAANAAAAQAAVVLTLTDADTGVTIGTATQPSLVLTIPVCAFDDISGLTVDDGNDRIVTLSGTVEYDDSNSPITILYTSADATA